MPKSSKSSKSGKSGKRCKEASRSEVLSAFLKGDLRGIPLDVEVERDAVSTELSRNTLGENFHVLIP